ncbi:P1 family peptidase [Niveispirillum sp. BGYR6]|uniref:P1 family peptidase n=1 Tax=Niveispirillum sp. BGYR6 TaxID=2971249 RepID=UPI0022B980CB|nr:P1 family peptidase [Niveispirillum sp. BGYR6]MDG5496052.1 P1 family peptidase [Niveispirillum sp. BGYR6]
MNPRPGPRNSITDIEGLLVGHATDEKIGSGVTVIRCGGPWVAAVDIRGGGPGVRETETLSPENVVGGIHALCLSGGSVFGLAAADGVVGYLSERDVGLRLRPGGRAIPIVPAAVLHDLNNPGDKDWGEISPYRALGAAAIAAAGTEVTLGSVGAGRGAMAGYIKGGIGTASLDLGDGLMVAALVAVNPIGSVLMPDNSTYWAWPYEIEGEFGNRRPDPAAPPVTDPTPDVTRLRELGRLNPGANTTLAVVATNAAIDKLEAKRIAIMAHDGMARAIRPVHTPFDGDLVFAIGSGAVPLGDDRTRQWQAARIGSAAADVLARAIARGVHQAGE